MRRRLLTAAAGRPLLIAASALLLAAAAADERPPALQEMIYRGQATSILGRGVEGPDQKQVGRIVDVLVDEQGQPRAAVVEVGGFMGVGMRKIAVAWRALHFVPSAERHHIRLEMTEDQIKSIPDYKPSSEPVGPPTTVAAPPVPPGTTPAAQ